MIFCDKNLAQRIDKLFEYINLQVVRYQTEMNLTAMDVIPIADGHLFRHPDYPTRSRLLGYGHAELPDDELLERIESLFEEYHVPGQIYINPYHDPELMKKLEARGWQLYYWMTILGRKLDLSEEFPQPPKEVEFHETDDDSLQLWAETIAGGFETNPVLEFERPVSHYPFSRIEGVRCWYATWEGNPAAGCNLLVQDDISFLMNGSTLPEYRRRGIHSAMIYHRLHEAAKAGAMMALYGAQTGGPSQQNAQRHGFQVLYNHPIMIRDGS